MTEFVRRSTRSRRRVTFYDPSESTKDRSLRIALKKSKLEASLCNLHVSESNDVPSVNFQFYDDLPECPTIKPSLSEFDDPIRLWSSLDAIGIEYGAVKVRAPEDWRPPFSLNLDTLAFTVKEQRLHRLASGSAFKHSPEAWSYTTYQQFAQKFKKHREALLQQKKSNDEATHVIQSPSLTSWDVPKSDELGASNCMLSTDEKITVTHWEKEYWKLVETQVDPVLVYYAADVEVNQVGSGFPKPLHWGRDEKSSAVLLDQDNLGKQYTGGNRDSYDFYASHPWNLLNLPTCRESLLKVVKTNIPGTLSLQVKVGSMHPFIEDNYFAAVNYQHYGHPKASVWCGCQVRNSMACKTIRVWVGIIDPPSGDVWYVIPPRDGDAMQKFMRTYIGHLSPEDAIHSLTVQISPRLLKANSLQVYRIVQHENEFVLLWPKTFHCGFNTGSNCNEACNVAPPIWLQWGKQAVAAYRFLRRVCLPFEQIVFLSAIHLAEFESGSTRKKILTHFLQLILEEFQWNNSFSSVKKLPVAHLDPVQLMSFFSQPNQPTQGLHFDDLEDWSILDPGEKRDKEQEEILQELPKEVFWDRIDTLARLPSRDCSQCYISCYQGFLMSSEKLVVLCKKCSERLLNRNKKKKIHLVYLYRFPLAVQKRLSQIIYTQFYCHDADVIERQNDTLNKLFSQVMAL